MQPLFFLLLLVDLNLLLILVVVLSSRLLGTARYEQPGEWMNFFSISFLHIPHFP